jgi:hypothetical protein
MKDLVSVQTVFLDATGKLTTPVTGQSPSGGGFVQAMDLLLPSILNQAGATPNFVTSASDGVDAMSVVGTGLADGFAAILALARGTVFNGATWDRCREVTGDAQAATGIPVMHGTLWNGATYDREYSASAANIAAQSGKGVQLVTGPGAWTITNAPGATTQASATKAAGGAGVRHVCTAIHVSSTVNGTGQILWVLRDGASGVGPILWQGFADGGSSFGGIYSQSNLNIVGSPNTAMTIETTAAPAAGQMAVNAAGYDTV